MVVIRDIAQKAGVSTAAVSIALHGSAGRKRVSDRTAARIRRIAADLKYRPSSAARTMSSSKTRQIGILLRNAPDIPKRNPANFETILGIGAYLAEKGYLQVLVPLSKLEEETCRTSRIFTERLLDGIMVLDVHSSGLYSYVRRNFSQSVFVDTNCWNRTQCIRRNEKRAGALAASVAMKAGYRRIIYVGPGRGPSSHYSVVERLDGVIEAVADSEVELVDAVEISDKAVDRIRAAASADTALVCYDTLIAKYVYAQLSQRGLVPPRGYGLVCCDDSHETELSFPMLSRAGFNRYDMGRLAAEMMVGSVESPDVKSPSKMIDVSWIPGGTISKVVK